MNRLLRVMGERFGRRPPAPPGQKAGTFPRFLAFDTFGQAAWTTRDFASLAREGFQQNAIAYRCVRLIAESAAAVPFLLYDGARELDSHPLLQLLARPNGLQSGPEFLEAWFGFLLIAGNSYAEVVELRGEPRELHVLRPDRMRVVPAENGWPAAYEYSVAGHVVRFETHPVTRRQPILHMRLFHPLDDHYGQSPIEAAAYGIDIHNAAGAWNKALLDNAARPSGALVYSGPEGAHLSEAEFARLRQELEDSYQGARNAGRPLLLEGGLDWRQMAFSPQDMEFIASKHVAAREIALAFGVPPMLLGIPGDNTYANYAEANRAFYRQTVLPLLGKTCGALSYWLAPRFGRDLRLWYDADQVDALASDREALWERVNRADFLTINEKRAAMGYGPIAGGDVLPAHGRTDQES